MSTTLIDRARAARLRWENETTHPGPLWREGEPHPDDATLRPASDLKREARRAWLDIGCAMQVLKSIEDGTDPVWFDLAKVRRQLDHASAVLAYAAGLEERP